MHEPLAPRTQLGERGKQSFNQIWKVVFVIVLFMKFVMSELYERERKIPVVMLLAVQRMVCVVG